MPTPPLEDTRTAAVSDLFDAMMRLRRSLRSRAGDWGHTAPDLTRGDIVALGVVERAGSSRPGQIAATLGVDPSVVSRQLTTLARLELISRGTDPQDGRAELVSATPRGRERILEAHDAMCTALARRLTCWDPGTIARASGLVGELAHLLHDHPGPRRNRTHRTDQGNACLRQRRRPRWPESRPSRTR